MEQFTDVSYGCRQKIKRGAYVLTAEYDHDSDMREPWKEHDGHGIVSDWTTRAKRPGEVVLCSDRSYYRYYDMEETAALAKRDGWGCRKEMPKGATRAQIAAQAALEDYKHLKAWCNDQWHWAYVTVTASLDGVELGHASLYGIESTDTEYMVEVANDLIDEALAEAKAQVLKINTLLTEA
jgi:hypothetical protein